VSAQTLAVLGPGGVGGLVAAALDRAGEPVLVVAREETAAVLGRDGLTVRSVSLGNWTARPATTSRLGQPVAALIVATKAAGLVCALQRVAPDAPRLVVPLLNGLDHVSLVRARFGPRACVGTVRVESDRPRTGLVVHSSPGVRIELADDDPARRPELEALAARFSAAGIDAEVGKSEAHVLWTKLARLCAIACTTTAFDRPVGDIRSDPTMRAALEGCVQEAVGAANAEGAQISAEQTLAELDALHPTLGSSMRRDVAAGREPELDAIAGAVMRAAVRHNLPCATIAELAARIADRAGVALPQMPHPA